MNDYTSKILIIDDDAEFTQLLVIRLKSFMGEISITHFQNLAEARKFLATLESVDFDLVIVDEHLPDGRGGDLVGENWFHNLAVLSVSSDDAPEIPGKSLLAGAGYFLPKRKLSEPLLEPLIRGIIDRNRLQKQLHETQIQFAVMDNVKTLIATLKHEINNPLGAVLGAAYLLKESTEVSEELKSAARLVETSGQRIKHVLEELAQAIELTSVNKANHKVFHIPGDKPWEKGEKND